MRLRFDQDGAIIRRPSARTAFVFLSYMDKPFKSYDELLSLLKSRGLSYGKNAHFILEHEGYYPVINGYKDLFLNEPDVFKTNSTLEEIHTLFVMDRRLKAVLFRYITLCESTLKTIATYEFCSRHQDDNEAYLIVNNYSNETMRRKTASKIVHEMKRVLGRLSDEPPRFMKPYLKHYINTHDNVPLWVLMNSLSLTQAFKFYSAQNESLRFAIAREYQRMYNETHASPRRITLATLERSYDHIKDFRNICAHDERLFCARVDKSQSTDFYRLLRDMATILTSNESATLCSDILEILNFTESNIKSIRLKDILEEMGLSSYKDITNTLLDSGENSK